MTDHRRYDVKRFVCVQITLICIECPSYPAAGIAVALPPLSLLPLQFFPVLIQGGLQGLQVTCVAAGFNHSAAVTSEGHLYTWGSNEFGKVFQVII